MRQNNAVASLMQGRILAFMIVAGCRSAEEGVRVLLPLLSARAATHRTTLRVTVGGRFGVFILHWQMSSQCHGKYRVMNILMGRCNFVISIFFL
jgi:hypothetical protein